MFTVSNDNISTVSSAYIDQFSFRYVFLDQKYNPAFKIKKDYIKNILGL